MKYFRYYNTIAALVILLALAQGASAHSKVDSDNVLNFSSDNGTTWQRMLPFSMSKVCWNNLPASGYESCETYTQWYPNITLSVSFNGDAAISKYDEQIPYFNSAGIYGVFRGNNSYTKVTAARRNASYFGGYKSYPDEPNTEAEMSSVISQYNLIKAADPSNLVSVTAFQYAVGSRNMSLAGDYLVFDGYTTKLIRLSCGEPLASTYYGSSDCLTLYYYKDDFIYAWDRNTRVYILAQAGTQYKSVDQLVKPVTLYSVSQKNPMQNEENIRNWFQATPKQQRAEMYWSLTAGYKGYGVWGNILNLAGSWSKNGTSHNQTQAIMINNLAGEYTNPNLQSYFTLPLSQQNKSWNYGDTWDNKVQFSSNPTKVTYGSTTSYTLSYRYYRNTTSSKDLLVVVNKGNSTLSDIGITISGLSGTRTATTLGTVGTDSGAPGRTKTVTNGAFTDTYYAYDAVLYEITAEQDIPVITSWGNNKTNDSSQSITINTSEVVMFNATVNQSITTWNWNKDGTAQSVNLSSINLSWDTTGTKSVSVTVTNDNGTSDANTWSVTVNPVSSNPSKIGIGGAGCSSPYCSTDDHAVFDYGSGYARYGYVWDSFNDGDYGGTVMAGTFSVQNGALRQTANGRIQYTLANFSNITMLLNVTDYISQTTDIVVMGDDTRASYNQAYYLALRTNNLSRLTYRNSTNSWIIINDSNYNRTTAPQYIVYEIHDGNLSSFISPITYKDALANGRNASGNDSYYTWGRNIVLQSTNTTYDDLWAHQWNRFDGNLTVSYDAGTGNEVPYFWLNLTGQHNATVRYRETDTGSYALIGTYTAGSNNISITGTKYQDTQVQIQLNGNVTSSVEFDSITFFSRSETVPPTTTGVWTVGKDGNTTFAINSTFDSTAKDNQGDTVVIGFDYNTFNNNSLQTWSRYTKTGNSISASNGKAILSQTTSSTAGAELFKNYTFPAGVFWVSSDIRPTATDASFAYYYHISNDTKNGTINLTETPVYGGFYGGTPMFAWYTGSAWDDIFSFSAGTNYNIAYNISRANSSYEIYKDNVFQESALYQTGANTTLKTLQYVIQTIVGTLEIDNVRLWNTTRGNLTTWHNAGTGNEIYQLTINATTPSGTNYSVYIRQNGTSEWSLVGNGFTGTTIAELASSARWSNTDVRIEMFGSSTYTPEITSVVFYSQTATVGGTNYMPPAPANLSVIYGSDNIRYTWQVGSGNVTNSYNTSWQITGSANWVNGSSGTSGSCTLSGHQWCNVTVQAYNHSGSGSLNATMLTGNNRLPNAAISISNISDNYNITEGQTLTVNGDYSDADGDTGIFNSSANQGSFDINTGILTWTTGEGDQGEYYWSMNVSDGWGSVATKEYIVNVGNSTPSDVSAASITNTSYAADTFGWLWILFSWTASDNTDRYYVFINGTAAGYVSAPEYYSNNFSAHTGGIEFSLLPHNTTLGTNGSWANKTVSIPNNAPTIDVSGITAINPDTEEEEEGVIRINETDYLNITSLASDIDADAITNSTNATSVFGGTFTQATATFSFLTNSSSSGTYYVDIGSCDIYGLCATNVTITVIISDVASISSSVSSGGGGGGISSEEVVVTPKATPALNVTTDSDTFKLLNTTIKIPDKKTVRIIAIVGFSGAIIILIGSALYNPRSRIVRKFKFNK